MALPSVSPAAPHELMTALRLLFGRRPDAEADARAERCGEALGAGAHDPAGLFVARDGAGLVCGAVLAQAMPGALGVMWPPHAETPEAEDALVRAACAWLRDHGVKVCQAFAAPDEAADMAPLERAGFRRVTDLISMRRELVGGVSAGAGFPMRFVSGEVPLDVRFTSRLTATLLETYEGTLDCPELNGTRTSAELVPETAQAGEHYLAYDPTRPDNPVGVVSLAVGAEPGAVDLSYVGVVPSARGRGYGNALVAFAIAEAARHRAGAVIVSVDARNGPALRLYRRHGFVETERRGVWLLHFPGEPGA